MLNMPPAAYAEADRPMAKECALEQLVPFEEILRGQHNDQNTQDHQTDRDQDFPATTQFNWLSLMFITHVMPPIFGVS